MKQYLSLEQKAKEIRKKTFEMVLGAGKGHLGGSFSCIEILVYLYYGGVLKFNPQNPKWEDRDIFVMSKGHSNNSLYVVLADIGFFPVSELDTFSKNKSRLGQHCDPGVPGIEIVTGSLGHGLGVISGIALGHKLDKKNVMHFVVIGDGESQEGSIWEAAMFANHHRLSNLIAFCDQNRLGSEDFIKDTANLEPLEDKWRAFGWDTRVIDGHSFEEIEKALTDCRDREGQKPLMIIANTIKGKGISAFENLPRAHHTLPKAEEIDNIRKDFS